jgi:hypothetical protein
MHEKLFTNIASRIASEALMEMISTLLPSGVLLCDCYLLIFTCDCPRKNVSEALMEIISTLLVYYPECALIQVIRWEKSTPC